MFPLSSRIRAVMLSLGIAIPFIPATAAGEMSPSTSGTLIDQQGSVSATVEANSPAQGGELANLIASLKLREEAAVTASTGIEKPEAIMVRLKANASPSGLKIDPDADFAIAAIDIGQRLVVKGKYAEAAKFFQEAETALVVAIAKTPDKSAREKAMFLHHLALVRGEYLNKRVEARDAIDAAIKLQPDEKYFQGFRDHLANDPQQTVSAIINTPKN